MNGGHLSKFITKKLHSILAIVTFSGLFFCLSTLFCSTACGLTLESFLEPNRRVDIVPVGRELIKKIHVREGEEVTRGQVLITLDHDVLLARRNTARILASAKGSIDSSAVVASMREKQLDNLEQLKESGHVRPKELEKAAADLAIARADLLSAREELSIRKAELQQIDVQIAKKNILSPLDGLVVRIHKEEGELVGNTDVDTLITVVQPYPLQATFHVPESFSGKIKDKVKIYVSGRSKPLVAKVLFASPLINPESGTTRLTVELLDSVDVKSGTRCTMEIDPVNIEQSK